MNWALLVVLLAAGTLVMRLIGPMSAVPWAANGRLARFFALAPVVLLVSLAVLTALAGEGNDTAASPARLAGVALAIGLVWRGRALIWVVLAAAATTAALRLLGLA